MGMMQFPKGCGGCNGSCCRDSGDCVHLTEDGLCKLEGDKKPKSCKDAVVGSPDCVAYRVKYGIN